MIFSEKTKYNVKRYGMIFLDKGCIQESVGVLVVL